MHAASPVGMGVRLSGCFSLRLFSDFPQVAFRHTAVNAEKTSNFFHAVIVVGAEFAARSHDFLN